MGDLLILAVLALALYAIVRKLFFKPKGQGHSVCVGCEGAACSSCDPLTLKENLKAELHKENCCH